MLIMIVKTHIIKQEYRDSVQLMRSASMASKMEGIEIASVLMGTQRNKILLKDVNMLTKEAQFAEPNDIVISIRANSGSNADKAIKTITESLLKYNIPNQERSSELRSLEGAITKIPNANLALISVPGEFAGREAKRALDNNLNVFLFSDNVSLDEEATLKKQAHQQGLLFMGPDCGTSMIKNIGLGFSNAVLPGPIGIVAASGSGAQEVMVLCHHHGVGVSHIIGTGSRDVKDAIGGLTMHEGLLAFERDPLIKLIIIISKPPEHTTMMKILNSVKECSKPVIINFLGNKGNYFINKNSLTVDTLEEAANSAVHFITNGELKKKEITFDDEKYVQEILKMAKDNLKLNQKYIRGLFAGGTYTFESALIISDLLPNEHIWSNVNLKGINSLENIHISKEHTLIDMGADEFTIGKPHPMIDQTERKKRFLTEINDPETAIILIDFVLGYGAHEDPIGDMEEAFTVWKALDRKIPIVAHVCGTELDPQDYLTSIQKLKNSGIIVMPSNAQAARLAALIITGLNQRT